MSTTDTPDSVYLDLPLDQLHDSPTNPRQVFDDASLQELAADIKSHGRVLQALLVRPRVPELFRGTDDPNAQAGYEIVFGHRRRRGAELAGLTAVRCEVRSMTDLEVQRAQISENLARKDVHPFEEAAGYQALIDAHGETADTIAASTGKSRSYIYGRLKLLQACPAVRQACLEGKVGAEVALLIARLRWPKLQEKALTAIEGKYLKLDDGGKKSFREIRDLLAEHFTLDLAKPLFDPDDATLLPKAGTCQDCPKRAGNAPEYTDLAEDHEARWGAMVKGNPDICTDPLCYQDKKLAHLQRQADEAREQGKVVIDGARAKASLSSDGRTVEGAYVALADVASALKKAKAKVTQVVIQDQRTGKMVAAVARKDLQAVGVEVDKPQAKSGGGYLNHNSSEARAERERLEAKAEAEAETARRMALFHHMRHQLLNTERTGDEDRVVALHLVNIARDENGVLLANLWQVSREDATWDDITQRWRDRIATMTRDDIARLMLDCTMLTDLEVGSYNVERSVCESLNRLATLHGVDPAIDLSTSAAAARAQDGAADDHAPADASAAAGGAEAPACRVVPASEWPFPGQRARQESQTDDAGSAGEEQTDNAGVSAGGSGAEVAA